MLGDAIIGFAACILEWAIYVLCAARRPFKYLCSKKFREEHSLKWEGRSKILYWINMTGGALILVLSILIIATPIYLILRPKPEPTRTEKIIDFVIKNIN